MKSLSHLTITSLQSIAACCLAPHKMQSASPAGQFVTRWLLIMLLMAHLRLSAGNRAGAGADLLQTQDC